LRCFIEAEPTQIALDSLFSSVLQPTVTGIIDRLERAGLVKRERSTADRRTLTVSLTAAGRDRSTSLPTPLQEEFLARLTQLSTAAERIVLLQSLARCLAVLRRGSLPCVRRR
jgi:DNA-binding MarR family transcriptional regulator